MQSTSGRYLWERSVSIPWRSITHGSTARKKVLEIARLLTVRAMRSVFYGLLKRLQTSPTCMEAGLTFLTHRRAEDLAEGSTES
jgi:hypothetical protein